MTLHFRSNSRGTTVRASGRDAQALFNALTATPDARCVGCGCTDSRACRGGCRWLAVDREKHTGVCSNCEPRLANYLEGGAQ